MVKFNIIISALGWPTYYLCETDASGDITAYYIHGPEIVGRIDADGGQKYYHTDPVGSVVALTDSTETVTDKYTYTPFGSSAGREGTTDNPFTYVGGYGVMTEDDGLYFMRARFYEPQTSRFLGKDPLEGTLRQPMSLYRYNYAANNPISYIDSDGHMFVFLGPPSSVGSFLLGEAIGNAASSSILDIFIRSSYPAIEVGNLEATFTFTDEGLQLMDGHTSYSLVEKPDSNANVPAFYDPKLDVFYVNGKAKKIN